MKGNKLFKILKFIISPLGVIFLICIIGVCIYYNLNHITFSKPSREAKLEIPITYNIGWWSNQNDLSVDSLKIKIVESNLNLFNSKSLISYTLEGEINQSNIWKIFIREIHISERINSDTSLHCDRIIELTPVIEYESIEKNNHNQEITSVLI